MLPTRHSARSPAQHANAVGWSREPYRPHLRAIEKMAKDVITLIISIFCPIPRAAGRLSTRYPAISGLKPRRTGARARTRCSAPFEADAHVLVEAGVERAATRTSPGAVHVAARGQPTTEPMLITQSVRQTIRVRSGSRRSSPSSRLRAAAGAARVRRAASERGGSDATAFAIAARCARKPCHERTEPSHAAPSTTRVCPCIAQCDRGVLIPADAPATKTIREHGAIATRRFSAETNESEVVFGADCPIVACGMTMMPRLRRLRRTTRSVPIAYANCCRRCGMLLHRRRRSSLTAFCRH